MELDVGCWVSFLGETYTFHDGDSVVHGARGEVVSQCQGKRLAVAFSGNQRAVNVLVTELSRVPPPPLPGDLRLGSHLYYIGPSEALVMHGEVGEVTGPIRMRHGKEGIALRFAGNRGHSIFCTLRTVSREPPPALLATPPARRDPAALERLGVLQPNTLNAGARHSRHSAAAVQGCTLQTALAAAHDAAPAPSKTRAADVNDSLVPYLEEIHRHYRETEGVNRVADTAYLARQPNITAKMRFLLVDWLVHACYAYKFEDETLHLTVNLIDRFLERKRVLHPQLQLVGVAALMIAAKYEEVEYEPCCSEFARLTRGEFSAKQIRVTERFMLTSLEFKLTTPSSLVFLSQFCKVAGVAPRSDAGHISGYLAELTLGEYKMLSALPSTIAAAAVCLARVLTHPCEEPWTNELAHHTGYSDAAVHPCVCDLHAMLLAVATTSEWPTTRAKCMMRRGPAKIIAAAEATAATLEVRLALDKRMVVDVKQ